MKWPCWHDWEAKTTHFKVSGMKFDPKAQEDPTENNLIIIFGQLQCKKCGKKQPWKEIGKYMAGGWDGK